jgi:hypothetical protein
MSSDWKTSPPSPSGSATSTRKRSAGLIARGELFSVKLGRRRLVPSNETDRYILALVDAAREAQAD